MRLIHRITWLMIQLFSTGNTVQKVGNTAQKEAQGRMMGCPALPCPLRVKEVKGFEGRTNDIIYCTPKNCEPPHSAVVYFGGDVQDFPEVMENHRDNKHYLKWNLENTAVILQTSFPESHIVIVKPSRMKQADMYNFCNVVTLTGNIKATLCGYCIVNVVYFMDELACASYLCVGLLRFLSPKLATFMGIVCNDLDYTRMEYKTFACYDNFVPSNSCGAPEHTPDHSALLHLERLLQSLSVAVRDKARTEASEDTEEIQFPSLDKVDLQLIGFSKGCVVLNQFLYEFHYSKTLTPDDDSKCQVVPRITDMFWLDGGHAGGRNTWITSRNLLETLARLGIRSHIHVTPYQINDDRRPWIRKEEKIFSELLHKMGAPVDRTVHFENQVPSLETHFALISEFKKS